MKKIILSIALFITVYDVFSQDSVTATDLSAVLSKNCLIGNNYIGGFHNADILEAPVFNISVPKNAIRVNNASALIEDIRAAKPNTVIYLEDNGDFDLSAYSNIVVPGGVTLMGGRGINKNEGALIHTNTIETLPLFKTGGNGVKFIGLRIQGPDTNVINPALKQKYLPANFKISKIFSLKGVDKSNWKNLVYGVGNSRGIEVHHSDITIENCEIYGWSHAGISVMGGNALIQYNYIHNNQRYGLGYGIDNDQGFADIKANIFKDNRHGIAGTGSPGTSYTASFNIFLLNNISQGHQIDMHGGKDRHENNNIAGDNIRIVHNMIFCSSAFPAILIRGNPRKSAYIDDNMIIETTKGRVDNFSKEMNLTRSNKLMSNKNNPIQIRKDKIQSDENIVLGKNTIVND